MEQLVYLGGIDGLPTFQPVDEIRDPLALHEQQVLRATLRLAGLQLGVLLCYAKLVNRGCPLERMDGAAGDEQSERRKGN
ncbi:MAG TPA: hypothetical protein VKU61_07885 [Candidatus Binatia bacterium]|nr:hypothetical protein [Candidatus Binatia bacterium]